MCKKFIACTAAVAALCLVTAAQAGDKLEGVKCPVSGKPINKDATVDYKGGKVYFCCPNCPKAFAAKTDKFAAKANHQLVQTGQAKQVKCPVKGKPIKASQSIEVAGVTVGFCCPGCKKKASSAQGAAQVNLLFGDKVFKKAYQVAKKEE